MEDLIDAYMYAGMSSINDLLLNMTIREYTDNIMKCINQRRVQDWHMLIGIVEADWVKVDKEPERYEEWYDELVEEIEEYEG